MKAGATKSFDSTFDQVAAPTPPAGVNAYFAYPSDAVTYFQKLSASFITESDRNTLTYKIQTIGSGGTMTLNSRNQIFLLFTRLLAFTSQTQLE